MVETDSPWLPGWHRDLPLATSLYDIPSCWTCSRYLLSSIWELSAWLQPWQGGAVALRHFWVLHLHQALMLSSWMNWQEQGAFQQSLFYVSRKSFGTDEGKKEYVMALFVFFTAYHFLIKRALATMTRTGINYSIKLIVLCQYPAENDRTNNTWKPPVLIWSCSCTSLGEGCLAIPSAWHQLSPIAWAQSWDCHLTPVTGALGASWAPHTGH